MKIAHLVVLEGGGDTYAYIATPETYRFIIEPRDGRDNDRAMQVPEEQWLYEGDRITEVVSWAGLNGYTLSDKEYYGYFF